MTNVPNVPSCSEGDGNTKHPPISPSKHWCFTFNNFNDEDLQSFYVPKFQTLVERFCFQEEVGENGTPHLQGYIEFKKKVRPKNLLSDKIHWEKCRNVKASIDYCQKSDTATGKQYFFNMKKKRVLKLINPDRAWEQEILDIIKTEPDERTIYWYYSFEGNVGKTSFCKYLTVKHGALPLSGKGADVRNGIVEYYKANKDFPEIVIVPIPRSYNTEYLSYEALENIKDMYFYSDKYKGGAICGPCPHLFVFSNELPELCKCSKDRWVVREIS